MKKIIRDIKIKYYEHKVNRMNKRIQIYDNFLVSPSTMMVDIPRYKAFKKGAEASAKEIYDILYKLRRENIEDCIRYFTSK